MPLVKKQAADFALSLSEPFVVGTRDQSSSSVYYITLTTMNAEIRYHTIRIVFPRFSKQTEKASPTFEHKNKESLLLQPGQAVATCIWKLTLSG